MKRRISKTPWRDLVRIETRDDTTGLVVSEYRIAPRRCRPRRRHHLGGWALGLATVISEVIRRWSAKLRTSHAVARSGGRRGAGTPKG